MKRIFAVLATITLTACSNSSGETDSPCGNGEEITADGASVCLYTANLIEEGFNCPPDAAVRRNLDDGAVLCSPEESVPQGIREELEDRGYDIEWVGENNNNLSLNSNTNGSSNNTNNGTTGETNGMTGGTNNTTGFVYTGEVCDNPTQTTVEIDDGLNGVVNDRRFITHDEAGNMVRVELDSGADGTVNATIVRSFDAQNRVTLEERDDDNDGVVDGRDTHTYTDTAEGYRWVYEFDTDADGTTDRIVTSNLATDGRTRIIDVEIDNDADGVTDATWTNTTWDGPPLPPTMVGELAFQDYIEVDNDLDGVADEVYIEDFDIEGNPLKQWHDGDADGDADYYWEIEYHADGRTWSVDSNAFGPFDHVTRYYTDAEGRDIYGEFDRENDGIFDERFVYLYTCP